MTWIVSICTYPRCRIAARVAACPFPNGSGESNRCACSHIRRARDCEIRCESITGCSKVTQPPVMTTPSHGREPPAQRIQYCEHGQPHEVDHVERQTGALHQLRMQ